MSSGIVDTVHTSPLDTHTPVIDFRGETGYQTLDVDLQSSNNTKLVCMYSFIQQHSPSLSSQPSLSGLKKVCVRSFPSSSGILNGSFLMLSYRFCEGMRGRFEISK